MAVRASEAQLVGKVPAVLANLLAIPVREVTVEGGSEADLRVSAAGYAFLARVETLLLDGYRSVAPVRALVALAVSETSDVSKPRKKAAAKSATKQSVAKKAASKSAKGPRHKRS
jgi:hypothetical protein